MPVINRVAALHEEVTAWRRDFHEHPEILFDVHRTAAIVAEKLKSFGVDEVITGIGRTGVVGVIRGRQNSSGKVIGMRADMDALPIEEATGKPWASKVPGKMHACGHDGHTAMLLGAAKYLAETRNFDGTAVVIFQPAEEGGGGGDAMVKDGMMERFGIQQVFGLHNAPTLPLGAFALRPGPLMASSDKIAIEVTGKGGHAAMPHACVDTTLVAAQIVLAVQSIVARNTDPIESAVISLCRVAGGFADNVIPETVTMGGTVRTLNPAVRDLMEKRLVEVVEGTAALYSAKATCTYERMYPVTSNHAAETDFAASVARQISGDKGVITNVPPVMGAEDFSFMLEARPGAFIFLGAGEGFGVHHPEYDFNDEIIPIGMSYWARLIETAMPCP